MPLYLCNTASTAVPADVAAQIANDITRIHCDVTSAPATFVHAFFVEGALRPPLDSRQVVLTGTIRAGRTADQKQSLEWQMHSAIQERTGLPSEQIGVAIGETPASWVMEGGDIMPEPGDEAEWLAAHAKRQPA